MIQRQTTRITTTTQFMDASFQIFQRSLSELFIHLLRCQIKKIYIYNIYILKIVWTDGMLFFWNAHFLNSSSKLNALFLVLRFSFHITNTSQRLGKKDAQKST